MAENDDNWITVDNNLMWILLSLAKSTTTLKIIFCILYQRAKLAFDIKELRMSFLPS